MFTGYVNTLLAEYAKDPGNNWQAKDCAIYLVVALTVRGKTSAMGATTTNQLVSIGEFFSSQARSPVELTLPFKLPYILCYGTPPYTALACEDAPSYLSLSRCPLAGPCSFSLSPSRSLARDVFL